MHNGMDWGAAGVGLGWDQGRAGAELERGRKLQALESMRPAGPNKEAATSPSSRSQPRNLVCCSKQDWQMQGVCDIHVGSIQHTLVPTPYN